MFLFRAPIILLITVLMCACTGEDENFDPNYYPGPNGEPPKTMRVAYKRQFVAEEKNYFKVLGEMHAFMLDNGLYPFYRHCVTDVVDITVTADTVLHKKKFPCLLVSSGIGEPPESYLTVTIDEVMFNQLDENNRLNFTVGIYGDKESSLSEKFKLQVEPTLKRMYEKYSKTEEKEMRRNQPLTSHPSRPAKAGG